MPTPTKSKKKKEEIPLHKEEKRNDIMKNDEKWGGGRSTHSVCRGWTQQPQNKSRAIASEHALDAK